MNTCLVSAVLVLCSCTFTGAIYIDLPDGQVQMITNHGAAYIGEEITQANTTFQTARKAFDVIKKPCEDKAKAQQDECASCIEGKCRSRAEDVCGNVLTKSIQFILEFPSTFEDKVINPVAVNVGKGIDFLKGFEAVGSGQTWSNVGVNIYDKIIIPSLENVVITPFEFAADQFNVALDFLKDIGSTIGIGKRKRSVTDEDVEELLQGLITIIDKRQPTSEPGCNEIKANASYYCLYYKDQCPKCSFDPHTQCPGYTEAVTAVQLAANNLSWLNNAKDSQYKVEKMQWDPAQGDNTGNYRNVKADVYIFGHRFSYTISEGINLFDAKTVGEKVAGMAIASMKASAPSS